MANTPKMTPKRIQQIIAALSEGKSVSAACERAGISRNAYYEWRRDDEQFARLTESAIEDGTDRLEDHALGRATDTESPSDTLTIFLLKARRPDKYRDNQTIRHEGHDGQAIKFIQVVPLPERADDDAS